MKDNSLDGHRGKVALSDTTRNLTQQPGSSSSNVTSGGKCELKGPPATATVSSVSSNNSDGTTATNFDDDYNEWELGIGDLIIDLDADIEKTNERNSSGNGQQAPSQTHLHHHGHHHSHHQNGTGPSQGGTSVSIASIIPSPTANSTTSTFSFLGTQASCNNNTSSSTSGVVMSNSKSSRTVGSASGSGNGSSSTTATPVSTGLVSNASNNSNGTTSAQSVTGAVEHQATVDKGLKMKIKRKTVGNKYSEAKHEIVQSDTKASPVAPTDSATNTNSANVCSGGSSTCSSIPSVSSIDTPKSKHSSSKGRNSSHREKKEKNRDKDKSSGARNTSSSSSSSASSSSSSSSSTTASTPAPEVNGVLSAMSPSLKNTSGGLSLSSPSSVCSAVPNTLSPLSQNGNSSSNGSNNAASPASRSTTVSTGSCPTGSATSSSNSNTSNGVMDSTPQGFTVSVVPQAISTSNSPPMPNLSVKLESKYTPTIPCSVVVKQEDRPSSPSIKRVKLETADKAETESIGSPIPPEMKDTSTCTSVGTVIEPDCLGPCEPGTSVMLEGIVWQETEGGVLVVNVTWRGKTYVGTLLDCTKHDWAPPRFCESPTSDVDAKTTKGRGKRGRNANAPTNDINTFDARTCVQSKLRNGKGRRTTINSSNFTVPCSPAKGDAGSSNNKRKGRPADLELTQVTPEVKASKRSRLQARSTPTPGSQSSSDLPQPSSPVLIECPEPNCNKKYKHINGLRYHQQHAHNSSPDCSKLEDANTEDSKDVTNSSDNEESAQESTSVPPSPAMSFTNTVTPHPSSVRTPVENGTTSNANSLPENDPYNLTSDLSTLASVAINDSKSASDGSASSPAALSTSTLLATAPQELPVIVSADSVKIMPSVLQCVPSCSPVPATVPSVISVGASSVEVQSPSVPVVAATNSVIHPCGLDTQTVSPPVTVSIPTSHVVFNQGLSAGGVTCATTTHTTTVAMSCHSSASLQSPRSNTSLSTVSASTYIPVASSSAVVSPTAVIEKAKLKPQQERTDKYKPRSPMPTPSIRPIVPAPTAQLLALSGGIPPSHSGVTAGGHGLVTSTLKPIQPKPTILGEPSTINPALESLKKEKSKHKKKSKDKDRERKIGLMPLPSVKLSSHSADECEPMEIASYPSFEGIPSTRDPMNVALNLPGATHAVTMSPLEGQKIIDSSAMDINLTEDNINENVQSPAYSDISDANDTAPVLESEVPSGKEKEDKVGKSTPDAAQSPAANLGAYGMYPYYSQPPYLLPSVSPQSSAPSSAVLDKQDQVKKLEQERIKETRPWSNPTGDLVRDRPPVESDSADKKLTRENSTPNSCVITSPAASNASLQEYHMQQQPYPYSYGYVQGYPYSVEPAYHMHLLDSDPHYKHQYKQYIEEQQRLYKEQQQQQQHHHQHSQQQQQHFQHHQPHHHSHQSHPHHQSKSHHSSMKDDRDRSRDRDHKERERAIANEKSSSSGGSASIHGEHSGKMHHSSVSMVPGKDHEVRDQDSRPPSLPSQSRTENVTPSSASASLKEKQNENHQILKENIELKSQMDDNKNKINQFEMAMLYERHREDMRRYYMLQERIIEQQQQKMDPGFHHHTHHHQTIQPHQLPSHFSSSSLKSHKDDALASISSHSKQGHYPEITRSSAVMSPAKSEHMKQSSTHPHSSSSPKGLVRESSSNSSLKDYSSSGGRETSSSKKESALSKSSDRGDGGGREEKGKTDKIKVEPKPEPEGQKPTMETTGPPPPPTNAYTYLHPSYLQPPPPHFPHMPFEPAHAVYRSGLNPMMMSTPSYGSSPYMHPQLRYVPPGACELPPTHSQASDPLAKGLHASGPPKALDLLHQVSQHYTTHKIHELQEHALMSPTPTSTPVSSTTPSTTSSSSSSSMSSSVTSKVSPSDSTTTPATKADPAGARESSRSPPTQRHLHTHHHTHVGVGYPIYDPYGAIIASPAPAVDVKPIHPLHQVKTPAAGRYWQ